MKSLGIPRGEHAGGGVLDPIYVETEKTYIEEYEGQGIPSARSRSRGLRICALGPSGQGRRCARGSRSAATSLA
eukprot:6892223-Pyramimonas_sp.AAC.1